MLFIFASLNKNSNKKQKDEKDEKGGKAKNGEKDKKGEKGECITGDGDKCLTCDEATNKFSSCNLGYKLGDSKYILNHSFKAVYKTDKKEQKIDLISYFGEYDIKDIIIDGVKAEVCTNYTFTDQGEHTVFYLLDNIKVSSSGKLKYEDETIKLDNGWHFI